MRPSVLSGKDSILPLFSQKPKQLAHDFSPLARPSYLILLSAHGLVSNSQEDLSSQKGMTTYLLYHPTSLHPTFVPICAAFSPATDGFCAPIYSRSLSSWTRSNPPCFFKVIALELSTSLFHITIVSLLKN